MRRKRKRYLISLISILALQIVLVMIFGLKKERLNIDEVFTYEGSKAGAVGCVYWDRTENFYGSWHTGSELIQDITLEEVFLTLTGKKLRDISE